MGLRDLLYTTALSALLAFSGCKKDKSPTAPEPNHPPTIERIVANPSEPYTDERVSLECIASDSDNDALDYIWDYNGGILDKINEPEVWWTSPSQPGQYHFSVGVEDNRGGHDSETLDLRVISRFDTILVAEDVTITSFFPNSNVNFPNEPYFGMYLDVYWGGGASGDEGFNEFYLKFGLVNEQRRVKSAKLKLTLVSVDHEDRLTLESDIHKVSESWDHNIVTWDSQPDYDITPVKRFIIPEYLQVPNTFYIEHLEDLVNSWIDNSSQNFGLLVKPIERDVIKWFYSYEGAREEGKMGYSPALILEYE